MSNSSNILEKHFSKSIIRDVVSINDLRDRDINGGHLTEKERLALMNYEHFRAFELNNQKTEEAFHNKYIQLQAMANLSPYDEFLKKIYSPSL